MNEIYVIVEMQTYESGDVGTIVTKKGTYAEAQSVYHSALASAALSDLPVHSVVLLNNRGYIVETKNYVRNKPKDAPQA